MRNLHQDISILRCTCCTLQVSCTPIQGGMKGVLWADTLQAAVMLAGLIAMLVLGCAKLGGIGEVFRRAEEHGRLQHWE